MFWLFDSPLPLGDAYTDLKLSDPVEINGRRFARMCISYMLGDCGIIYFNTSEFDSAAVARGCKILRSNYLEVTPGRGTQSPNSTRFDSSVIVRKKRQR